MNLSAHFSTLQTQLVHFFPKFLSGVFIFILFYIGSRLLGSVLVKLGKARHLNADVVNLAAKSATVTLLFFGVVTVLGTFGVDVSALVAGLGLTGFALGLALKDIVSNVLSGILVLLYKPFVRGDVVDVTGSKGRVSAIDLRYTILETEDHTILIPNSTLFANIVTVEKRKVGHAVP